MQFLIQGLLPACRAVNPDSRPISMRPGPQDWMLVFYNHRLTRRSGPLAGPRRPGRNVRMTFRPSASLPTAWLEPRLLPRSSIPAISQWRSSPMIHGKAGLRVQARCCLLTSVTRRCLLVRNWTFHSAVSLPNHEWIPHRCSPASRRHHGHHLIRRWPSVPITSYRR